MAFATRRRKKLKGTHWESVYRISPTKEVTAHQVAKSLDCTLNTARSRLRNKKMTVEDLYRPINADKNHREPRAKYPPSSMKEFRRRWDDPMYRLAFAW